MTASAARQALELLVEAVTELGERAEEWPHLHQRWLPLQFEFLSSDAQVRQIRAGNQTIGKTWAMLALIVGYCTGRHPLGLPLHRQPPVTVWVVCSSWSQSLALQEKLWELLPKSELSARTKWDPVNGFSPTKSPAVVFGNGSVIRIKTANQEAIDFSSASIDVLAWDEPPKSQRLYTEGLQRVAERGGYVLLSYTPVNAPTDYLRSLVEAGQIEDFWRPLTPAELIPVGSAEPMRTSGGELKDQAWIDRRRRKVPEHEQPVVIDGEWEMRNIKRYFSCFRNGGQDSHVHTRVPTHDVPLLLGIDHGSAPGKQIVLLIAAWREEEKTRIYVVDEYTDKDGTATPVVDAKLTLAMLDRHGLKWRELSFVGGDRVHMKGTGSQKSNKDLAAQIAKLLRVPLEELRPPIRTIKRGEGRGAGSVQTRSRWLFHRLVEDGGFGVHPRCKRLIEAFEKYDLRDNEYKDPIDALVYGLDQYIFERWTGAVTTHRFQ